MFSVQEEKNLKAFPDCDQTPIVTDDLIQLEQPSVVFQEDNGIDLTSMTANELVALGAENGLKLNPRRAKRDLIKRLEGVL